MKKQRVLLSVCLLLLVTGCNSTKLEIDRLTNENVGLQNRISDLEDQRAYLEDKLYQAAKGLSPDDLYLAAKQYMKEDQEKAKAYLQVLIDKFPDYEKTEEAKDLFLKKGPSIPGES